MNEVLFDVQFTLRNGFHSQYGQWPFKHTHTHVAYCAHYPNDNRNNQSGQHTFSLLFFFKLMISNAFIHIICDMLYAHDIIGTKYTTLYIHSVLKNHKTDTRMANNER